jgi:hypothetical protein
MLHRLRRGIILLSIAAAVSFLFPANRMSAQGRTVIEGVWSTPFTARDHPAWAIEDHLCPFCPPVARAHFRKLLADPANDSRRLQDLAQESNRVGNEHMVSLITDEASARLKRNSAASNDAVIRCEPPDLITLLRAPQPIVITVNDDHVIFHHDHWNTLRAIRLGGPGTAPAGGPTRLGVATARFEGSTLVVESRNLLGIISGGITTADGARIVERWTPSGDGKRLILELVIDDPASYRAPLALEAARVRTPGEKIFDMPPCEAISGQL